jgi:uncharacterized protein YukE
MDLPLPKIPNPIDVLGAMPVGSPDAMRDLARELRKEAVEVKRIGNEYSVKIAGLYYKGPAATRTRTKVRSIHTEADRQAVRMEELAAYLEREANELQHTQEAWKRAAKNLVDEAMSLRRRIQQGLT